MQRTWSVALAVGAALVLAPVALGASPSPSHHEAQGGPVSFDTPAAQLRVDLDRLLAEHAFLTIEQMRSGLTDSPDFAAAATAVEGNSTDVANAIGSVYGDAAVAPFGDIWRSHIGYLVDYSVALGKDDADASAKALEGLTVYRANLREFLAGANPGISLAGITEALDTHTAQLVAFIDLEHQGDHAGAYEIEREAYPHMFDIGDALAKVIANKFPDRFGGLEVAYSSAGTLRVTLDRLLGEHAFLAAEAMRSGVGGQDYFDAAKSALDANTADLQALVAAAYGQDGGAAFREHWDAHIAAYLEYIDAAKAGDATAKAAALDRVNQYASEIAAFLASANPNLDANAVTGLLQQHAGHLTGQVDAFTAQDYDGTYAKVREGYSHMFTAGEALAGAIATQFPDKFPSANGAPATDVDGGLHGGHAPDPFGVLTLISIFGLGVAGASIAWLVHGRGLRRRG